ncbi:MAG: Na/Pi cotransporter family protein [Ruminococcaceae bacterium]|nr:Na/Pi cotransporter family protein [Oscillospiraceae bacterium]
MISSAEVSELLQSLVWMFAGISVFIVGMNFLSGALERCAGSGMKKLLEKISNNRFSGVGIGAGVTAIIQSSAATTIMAIGLVNAGVMTLMQATPIIMGANIGTTVTGLLVALKNDFFNMAMYFVAFIGVMMGFAKKEKLKLIGSLFCGLGLIFVGLNIMSSEDAFGSDLIERVFTEIFSKINFPLLLILIGIILTALIQSSSASTGIVITMVGTGLLSLDLALFIILGANIGTCVTAFLASFGANSNSKRVAMIHLLFNVIGTVVFTAIIWIFKEPTVNFLISIFPNNDPMSLQMRVSVFHVIFNVSTTLLLLPFTKHLVKLSTLIIKDKKEEETHLSLKFVDDRLISTPPVALMQVKKEMDYMLSLVEANIQKSFVSMDACTDEDGEFIRKNEEIIDFTNSALTKFLIKLSSAVEQQSDERVIGSYFHVLNDLERIGDHAENFYEIGYAMTGKEISFSEHARGEIRKMREKILKMFEISKDAFENLNKDNLPELTNLENSVDDMKKALIASHFARLAEGNCNMDVSPYYSSVVAGLERVADHLVNVGYSIMNPTGSQKDKG